MNHLYVFLAVIVLEYAFAFYTRKTTEGVEYSAGAWAAFIILLNAIVTLLYVSDKALIPAAMAGAFIGTIIAIKVDNRKRKKK